MKEFLLRARKFYKVFSIPFLRQAFFKHRVVASVEHYAVLMSLANVESVVDIGANRGQFSLLARYFFPRAKIYSFEPLVNPVSSFRCLFASDPLIHLFNVAIGPVKTDAFMHVSAREDSSSLLPIGHLQSSLFSNTREVGTACVNVAPLSTFLSSDDFLGTSLLKIDVQGYEYQVLLGSESYIDRFTYIYCECSFVELYTGQNLFSDIVGWLADRGFVVQGVYNVHYDLDDIAIQSDVLFVRQSSSGYCAG